MPFRKLIPRDLENARLPAKRVEGVRMRSVNLAAQQVPCYYMRLHILRANRGNLAFALALGEFGGKCRIGCDIHEHRKRLLEIGRKRTDGGTQRIVARFNGEQTADFLDPLRDLFGGSGVSALQHRLRKKPVNAVVLERLEQRPATDNNGTVDHRQPPIRNEDCLGSISQAMKLRLRTESRDRRCPPGADLRSQHRNREVRIRHVPTHYALNIRNGDRLDPLEIMPAEPQIPSVQPIQPQIRRHSLNGLKLFDHIHRKDPLRLLNFLLAYSAFMVVINASDHAFGYQL